MVLPNEIQNEDTEQTGNPLLRSLQIGGTSALASALGLPGDIESLGRSALGLVSDVPSETILPTSESLKERARESGKLPTPSNSVESLIDFGGGLFGTSLGASGVRGVFKTGKTFLKGGAIRLPKPKTILENVTPSMKQALSFAAAGTAIEGATRAADLPPLVRAAAQIVIPSVLSSGAKILKLSPSKAQVPAVVDRIKKIGQERYNATKKFTQPLKDKGLRNFERNFIKIEDRAREVIDLKQASEAERQLAIGMIKRIRNVGFGKKVRGNRITTNFSPDAMFRAYRGINEEISRVTQGKDAEINGLFTKIKQVSNESMRVGGATKALEVNEQANQAHQMLQDIKQGQKNIKSFNIQDLTGEGLTGAALSYLAVFYGGLAGTLAKLIKGSGVAKKLFQTKSSQDALKDTVRTYGIVAKDPELQKAAADMLKHLNAKSFNPKLTLAAMKSFEDEFENFEIQNDDTKVYKSKRRGEKSVTVTEEETTPFRTRNKTGVLRPSKRRGTS